MVAIKTVNLVANKDDLAEYEARFQEINAACGRPNHPHHLLSDVGR
jgi:hypothetical protein